MVIKKTKRNHCKSHQTIYYGLSAREVRTFSFEYAMALNINILAGWRDTKMAGTEWLAKCLERCKTDSLHKPEATSIS
jgi:hypothetical protein